MPNKFIHSGSSNGFQEKILKQNAVRSKNVKLKCRKFSTLQKREIKMQRKISVLQYYMRVNWEPITRPLDRESYALTIASPRHTVQYIGQNGLVNAQNI